jgi:hypothetical protein
MAERKKIFRKKIKPFAEIENFPKTEKLAKIPISGKSIPTRIQKYFYTHSCSLINLFT